MTRFTRLAFLISIVGGSLALGSACGNAQQPTEQLGKTKQALSTTVVISQFYGFGGSTTGGGAAYKNDYVELFNMSASDVNIGGWSIQYGSTANNFSLRFDIPTGTMIGAGKYYLIKLDGGTTGADLPTPDLDATMPPDAGTAINLAQAGGKIALVNSTTTLTCGAAASRCDYADAATGIIDMVGYGTSADYEGSASAPASTVSNAVFRALGGCKDTDQNSADFAAAAAAPRNSATTAVVCGVDAGVDGAVEVAVDGGPDIPMPETPDTKLPDVASEVAMDAVVMDTAVVDAIADAPADAPTDTGTPADTGTPPTDTGTAPEDTGSAPEDTGSGPLITDTGTPTADTGPDVAPAETSDDSGCGCSTPRTTENTAGLAALVLGLAIASRRRRR
jgi:MYXO-CTERM domain-containing protein